MKIIAIAVALLASACGPKLNASAPATATIQTDAGEKVCEYVTVQAEGRDAQIGVCADNDNDLKAAVAIVNAAYPVLEEYTNERK